MLGIALYPDKTKLESDIEYLKLACSLGYQRVFMSMLQIDINNSKKSIERLKESIKESKKLGFNVTLDIHPMVFDYLNIKPDNLAYFKQLGVDVLRLDSSFNGRIEAMMTHNSYHLTIELNMSNDIYYLELIENYHPNHQQLQGSHNFYPQRYTGLSLDSFISCSKRFKKRHIHTAAFVTSSFAKVAPWPISEGLCTLENHRDLPIEVQARHLKMLNLVDDIIIGNAYASKEELNILKEVVTNPLDKLHVIFNEETTALEKEMVCRVHDYRGDASEYVIRSSHNRHLFAKESIISRHLVQDIHKGDVLILNDDYGQYKGEMQIALKDRVGDVRINIVGRICEEEHILIDALNPFQQFELKEK